MSSELGSICEEAIYTKIFKEYAKTLHNYLFYKSGSQEIAQDLTQEAFTKLWQNCAEVQLSTAKGYVFKVANNMMLNQFEHNKVVLKFQQIPRMSSSNQSPAFLLEEKELKERLEAAIAALPEKQRVVFLLSRIEKKTYKQIAELLEISKQAVEKRMYNALDALRLISKNIK